MLLADEPQDAVLSGSFSHVATVYVTGAVLEESAAEERVAMRLQPWENRTLRLT